MVTVASGLAILLRPDSALWGVLPDPEPSEEATQLTNALCRPDGWDFKLTLGDSTDFSIRLAFELDPRFTAYPQGSARLVRSSRFLDNSGLWSVEVLDEDGLVPNALEVCLTCETPIGDDVPAGQIFLQANLERDERATRVAALTSGRTDNNAVLNFDDGRVVVKDYGGFGGLAGLSELKVAGSFEARPATTPMAQPASSRGGGPPPPPSMPLPPPPTTLLQTRRRWSLAALSTAVLATATSFGLQPAGAVDLQSLASQPLGGTASDNGLPIYPILSAQKDVRALLADEETFRTMVKIGLSNTGELQMPPNLAFSLFKRFEAILPPKEAGEFMDAAIEYIEYARDANDLVELARMSRTNGGGPLATADYLDRACDAARGASKALDRMVPLMPK